MTKRIFFNSYAPWYYYPIYVLPGVFIPVVSTAAVRLIVRFHLTLPVNYGSLRMCQKARIYFKELFGKDFDRRSDNGTNACLNYGYAIVRGLIARTLAARGFSAFLGIHHASELNAFNLADDFIEPYRAIVDRTVSKFSLSTLDSDAKKLLFNLNNTDVSIDNANQVLPRSIEICIDSYMTSLEQGVNKLKLPIMQEIKSHEYL